MNAQVALYDPLFWAFSAVSYTDGDPCQEVTFVPASGTVSASSQTYHKTQNSCFCGASISDQIKGSITYALAGETIVTSGSMSGSVSSIYPTEWIDPAVSLYEQYCTSINAGVTFPIATGANVTYPLAPATSSTSQTATSTPSPAPEAAKTGLPTGAKVGIVVGVAVAVVALVLLALLLAARAGLIKKNGAKRMSSKAFSNGTAPSTPMSPIDMSHRVVEPVSSTHSPGTGTITSRFGGQADRTTSQSNEPIIAELE
jgi:hypothetical protein